MMMFGEQRRQAILTQISHHGSVRTKLLSEEFKVSEMTIRRDLKQLEDNGLVRAIHGGAISTKEEPFASEVMFDAKQERGLAEKMAIAAYATAHFVDDDDIIYLGPRNDSITHGSQPVYKKTTYCGYQWLDHLRNAEISSRQHKHHWCRRSFA